LYYGIDFVNLSIAKQKPYELLYGTILPEDFFIPFKLMRSMDYTLNVGFSNMYIKENDKTQ